MDQINMKDVEPFLDLTIDNFLSDFTYIGGGSSRTVFDLGNNIVVKIAEEHYKKDNINEWRIWNKAPEHLKKFLTPCYLHPQDERIIFMIKGEPVKFNELQVYIHSKKGLETAIEVNNAIFELSEDFKLLYADLVYSSNWASFNGELKLIDYGLVGYPHYYEI